MGSGIGVLQAAKKASAAAMAARANQRAASTQDRGGTEMVVIGVSWVSYAFTR